MKRLKQIFSFMLVGVLALTGSIVLTGCFKEDEKPVDKNIQTATTVLTNLKNYYTELEAKADTCIGNEIPEIENASTDIFADYNVIDSMSDFLTLDSNYVEDNYSSNFVSKTGLALLNVANFEFGKFYGFNFTVDGEPAEYAISLEFSSSKIRLVGLYKSGVGSDVNISVQISDVYYDGFKPVCLEFINIGDEDNYLDYEKIVMSSHDGIGLNYVVEFETYTDIVDLDIYSEVARKKANVAGNLTTYADVIEIVQAKRTQLLETADYNWDEISKNELSETDERNLAEAMFS